MCSHRVRKVMIICNLTNRWFNWALLHNISIVCRGDRGYSVRFMFRASYWPDVGDYFKSEKIVYLIDNSVLQYPRTLLSRLNTANRFLWPINGICIFVRITPTMEQMQTRDVSFLWALILAAPLEWLECASQVLDSVAVFFIGSGRCWRFHQLTKCLLHFGCGTLIAACHCWRRVISNSNTNTKKHLNACKSPFDSSPTKLYRVAPHPFIAVRNVQKFTIFF